MATSTITLACLLLGETVPFEVFIDPSSSVNNLKKAIKKELAHSLSGVDAFTLALWKVNIPYAARASITEDTLKEEDVMGPLDEISEYFQLPPPKKHIHVIMDRIAAISALLRELDDYRRVYGRTYDTRASKRRRSDESEDDDEDENGGGGRRGGKSGGAPGSWWRSFTERVSINVSKPAAGGSREVEQEPFDSDIGFFRDDPDEIVSSYENAKKWAMEFIHMGGIVGIPVKDSHVTVVGT
ncbi:hypothetical protein M427DRAFT_30801 [Gonapodya prolifera JEL478]|uniref:Crinkler effector protein N-terminal domain-containing protein n=1 Tax=Gonapodya prolifera (strain JEL478) TaxID=1344416 RepID=A0A139AJN8_GONPJ|nr:hypothetical protein M427DRAFT_30801 [Gonapodya prolifera JEL478]|eukprot:KXS16981.1 hypothetical protein M427DRAFT_30801 [Gonapodya prolifera JEL478]